MTWTPEVAYRAAVDVTRAYWRWRGLAHPGGPPPFVLPIVAAFVQLVGTLGAQHNQPDRRPVDTLAVVLLLAGPAALLGRHRWPLPALAAVAATTLGYLLRGYPWGPFFLSLAVALVIAVRLRHRLAAWLAGGAVYAGYFGLVGMTNPARRPDLGALLGTAAWLLVVLGFGELSRASRERAAETARSLAEEERRRASDERLRIARELHDVLAHNISLINVQAGVALHLMDGNPEQVRAALTAIKQASKDALVELRSTLGVLRAVDEDVPRAPAARLAQVEDLVGQVRAAGLAARVEVDGERRTLPAGVDLAAYRIIQEALTNVRKHAPGASATVHIGYAGTELLIRVDDDGPGLPGPLAAPGAGGTGGGNGLPGMRERAGALGGELVAGPRPGGGFRVQARLPLPPAAAVPNTTVPSTTGTTSADGTT